MSKEKSSLKYSASLVSQGTKKFYTLTMPTDVLGRTCFVSTRDEDPKKGFQRLLDKKRAQEIADYIDTRQGSIPSAIILSAQTEAELKFIGGGKTIQFKDDPKAFLILDGQHRVYGYSLSKSAIRVPVVIYNNLTRKDESRIFIDINTKQKPVPNELLFDIKSLAEYETQDESFLNSIFTLFHEESGSCLIGLTSPSDKSRNKISRVTFYGALRPIIKFFGNREAEDIYEVLNIYLNSCIKAMATRELESYITNSVVFKGLVAFFPTVARHVKDKYGSYHEDSFNEILFPVFSTIRDAKIKKPGLSYKTLFDYLESCLESNFTI
jgi:DGQHR domain-containing protein